MKKHTLILTVLVSSTIILAGCGKSAAEKASDQRAVQGQNLIDNSLREQKEIINEAKKPIKKMEIVDWNKTLAPKK